MMLALEMYRSIPRYLAAKAVGGRIPGVLTGPAAPVRLITREEPRPPASAGWARVRPTLSGICGSDLGALFGQTSLYFSAMISMPFVPGHEVVGELQDDCDDLPAGTRVVLDSVLACAARGIEPCESCASGRTNVCNRITVGHVSPGLQTGYCADTGGGWGGTMVAHRSQLYPVPDGLTDERAVLVEPLACAAHTVTRARIPDGASVLVSGAGSVGLFLTLALRRFSGADRISVVAKHPRQRELARLFGATDVFGPDEVYGRVRRATGAFRLSPERGPDFLLGGVDVAFDAVGSKSSMDTVFRTTRPGGRVVLSGMPNTGADLSPVWFRELEVTAAYATNGAEAFGRAFELAESAPLDGVVGGRYPLYRWREALDHAHGAGRLGTVKVAFDLRSSAR